MPFEFHNKERISNLLEELEVIRYEDVKDIDTFDWYLDDGEIGNREPKGESEKVGIGFRWKGWDRYNWLCSKVTLPKKKEGKKLLGFFDFGVRAGSGNNSHFESMLYVDKSPYQAVDGNHKEVFFDDSMEEQTLQLDFRVWSGLNGGGKPSDMPMEIKAAKLCYLDEAADGLFFLSRSIIDTYELLDTNHPSKEWMLNKLVKAFNLIDYTVLRSKEFYASCKTAYDYLNKEFKGQDKPDINVSLVGHTHIDVAWLWRLKHTREKAARSFTTVHRLMEQHPEYVFLQSQAQLYDYIKNDYPEIYEKMKQRISEGRWEPSGAMWVECDCNLASGEAIVRQILVGKNFFKKEFNFENDFLWLPDVFGYSWALPQILIKSGVKTFVTSKISWNDTNRMPYDTFSWRGLDGSEILTQFITTAEANERTYTYNGDTRPLSVKGVWDNYSNKDLNSDLFISYGYGDGGGGPNRDMIETMKQLNKIPGLPHVRSEFMTETLKRLHNNIKENKKDGYLPVWDGELYLEFHRGTYTSQAYNKKMNRVLEFKLRDAEMLSVIGEHLGGLAYNKNTIDEAWKILLRNQFHDILPGSSIHEVYEDCHVEYGQIETMLKALEDQVYSSILSGKEGYSVWNNSNWKRSSYVKLPEGALDVDYKTSEGIVLKSEQLEDGIYIFVENMEPCSFTQIIPAGEKTQKACCCGDNCGCSGNVQENEVENKFYKLSWNEFGQLTSIYDKKADREVIPEGKCANVLQIFEDKPRFFNAWELESTVDNKMEQVTKLTSVNKEENCLGTFVTFVWEVYHSTITQTMIIYKDSLRIDFKTKVDWKEHEKLLKAAFPVNIRATSARYDIQYGNIVRPITRNTSWEAAKYEVVAHKWIDLSETGYGVALLNDCKYGHDVKDDTMRITLLKSPVDPDYDGDYGYHEFTYALLPHTAEWYLSNLEQESFDLNNKLTAVAGIPVKDFGCLVTLEGQHVMLDCVKKAENSEDIVIRFHEFGGARGSVTVKPSISYSSWCESDLMEQPEGEFSNSDITLDVKPYEIKTVILKALK